MKCNCQELLHIIYNHKAYHVNDFNNYCKKNNLYFDQEMQKASFDYKGTLYTNETYQKNLIENSQKFNSDNSKTSEYIFAPEFASKFHTKIFLALSFLGNLGEKITAGNYYAINSYYKLSNELFNTTSYRGFYFKRYLDFCTSMMWYNSCFDIILQIFCVKFSLYSKISPKKHKVFKWQFINDYYNECSYSKVKTFINQKSSKEMKKWWKTIEECYNSLTWIRENTNSIKHRTSVAENELNFGDLQKFINSLNKKSKLYISNEINIDDDYSQLINAHNSIVQVYYFIMGFYNKEIKNKEK